MKKYIFTIGLICCFLSVFAMPAKRGTKKTLTLADGTTVTATLCGDEFGHFWVADDGRKFNVDDENRATVITEAEFSSLKTRICKRRNAANNQRTNRLKSARKTSAAGTFVGEKKGLVILVNFQNLTFKEDSAQMVFDDIFNKVGYDENDHIGSVHDYFYDQSYGQFDLDFDVVGPVTVSKNYVYYGKNDSSGNDSHPCEMVINACELADSLVNFADYDWDGDGYVDQVYIIYAGYGENAGAATSTIWPHEWQLSSGEYYNDGDGAITLDGVMIDTYAVSCELAGTYGSTIDGIGTACHEFSHCLGYPDFYDTDYSGAWGMNSWDILDEGSYNGPNGRGEIPAGYSSYERWVAGWLQPIELTGEEVVDSMKPLNDEPEAYIIYNDAAPSEYYMMENRQPNRWFSYIDDSKMTKGGMLVLHVDYDEQSWFDNTPNDNENHQRMTIVPANNKKLSYMAISQYMGQLYPYSKNDSLTNLSKPLTETYNVNSGGRNFLTVGIENITRNTDGTMSFNSKKIDFTPLAGPEVDYEPVDTLKDEIVFYESFNKCNGTGGNDDKWSGVASNTTTFITDNDGWSSGYGADGCAKFGTASKAASAVSPEFDYEGDVTITFKAAAWDNSKDGTDLTLYINDEEMKPCQMEKCAWHTYGMTYTLNGPTKLTFKASLRMFLDEVGVAKIIDSSGIENIQNTSNHSPLTSNLYNIAGQKVGSDYKGIIIRNGKKILNR